MKLGIANTFLNAIKAIRFSAVAALMYFSMLVVGSMFGYWLQPDVAAVEMIDPEALGVSLGFTVLWWLVSGYFALGFSKIAIDSAFGRPVVWKRLLVSMKDCTQIAVAMTAIAVATTLGFVFFVIPGIVLMLMWSQSYYSLLDHDSQWLESLSRSRTLTRGQKIPVFAIWIVVVVGFGVTGGLLEGLPGALTIDWTQMQSLSQDLIQQMQMQRSPKEAFVSAVVYSGLQVYVAYVGAALYQNLRKIEHNQNEYADLDL